MTSEMTSVIRSPRIGSPAPDSPVLRGNAASPAGANSSPRQGYFGAEGGSAELKQSSKGRLEDARLQLGVAKGLSEPPLSTRRQVAAVGLAMVTVLQVVASKAVLNAISTPVSFLVGTLLVQLALLRLWCGSPPPSLSVHAAHSSISMTAVTVLGLLFNTIALQTLELSFYQIARGLVLPFSSFFAAYIGMPSLSSSSSATATALLVVAGFLLAALAEPASAAISVLFSVFGVLATVFRPRFVSKTRAKLGGEVSSMDLVWYSSIFSLSILAPLALIVGEGPLLLELASPLWSSGAALEGIGSASDAEVAKVDLITFVVGTLLVGCFNFVTSIATGCDIRRADSAYQMVAISLRGVSLTWLSIGLFADVLTPARLVGIMLVTLGSILHTHCSVPIPAPLSLPVHSSPAMTSPFPLLDPSSPSSISRPHKPRPLSLSPEVSRRQFSPIIGRGRASPTISPALGKVEEEDERWSNPSSVQSTPTRTVRIGSLGTPPSASRSGLGITQEEQSSEGGESTDNFEKW